MSDPVGPPTLFKLAVNALVAGCKKGNHKPTFDPQKIPPAVGKSILNQISLMEIIIIASNQHLYNYISSLLPDNFVTIDVWIVNGSRPILIELECDGRPNLFWDFVYQNDSNFDQSQFFMLKIADKVFPTEFIGVHYCDSFVPNSETAEFEIHLKIIDWICQLFRRELNEFKSFDGSAEEYLKSSAIINAQSFEMTDCCYQYAFLEKLLTVRHQRGLKTQTTCVQIKEPLQFSPEFFGNLEITRDADLNFTFYSIEEVVQVITPWMPRLLRIRAKIPNWSPRDLRVFRRRLNLKKENDNIVLKEGGTQKNNFSKNLTVDTSGMEEPKGPLSLFKLACDALCNSAKNGILNSHFDPQKVPPAIRECIWEHCSLIDIITLSSAMDSTEFFSPIARSHVDEISMTFRKLFNGKCVFRIECVGKASLTWYIRSVKRQTTYTEFSNTFYPVFTLTIGDVHNLTRMMYDGLHIKVFESNSLDPPRTTQAAVANWLHRLFQKEFERNID